MHNWFLPEVVTATLVAVEDLEEEEEEDEVEEELVEDDDEDDEDDEDANNVDFVGKDIICDDVFFLLLIDVYPIFFNLNDKCKVSVYLYNHI